MERGRRITIQRRREKGVGWTIQIDTFIYRIFPDSMFSKNLQPHFKNKMKPFFNFPVLLTNFDPHLSKVFLKDMGIENF